MASSLVISTTTTTITSIATEILNRQLSDGQNLPPPPLSQTWQVILNTFIHHFLKFLNLLNKIPGGPVVLRYIKSSYQNDPIRSLFEYCLFIFALTYFFTSKKKENKSEIVKFSSKEIDELCNEWEPEPLVKEVINLQEWQLKSIPEIVGQNQFNLKKIIINNNTYNDEKQSIKNFASQDFLNLNENQRIKDAAEVEIKYAGVGACGPPNFYGTQDVHVRVEEDLAEFLDSEQAIIYGQDYVTAGSVIPAFLKRGDLCVVDRNVNNAVQKALIVSRADIEWFDHNDMDHLNQILTQLKPVLDKQKPIKRRFIVTEGLFANSGDIVNLPKIVELKNKFKYRLFLDESLSIGTLGITGKGVAEHFNIPRAEISITIGSMANSFASSGGFCVGVSSMVHHQRISSNAYVFSASLPPYSAKVTSQAIKVIKENIDSRTGQSKLMTTLHKITNYTYQTLSRSSNTNLNCYFDIVSSPQSPMIHLQLKETYREKLNLPLLYGNSSFITTGKPSQYPNKFDEYFNLECFLLQKVIDLILTKSNILLTRSKIILEHEDLPVLPPHLLINLSASVTKSDIDMLVESLDAVVYSIFKNIQAENDLINLTNEILNY
ncbi:unnamed protein product [Candida verbasci]|uniref:serine C-palmitoyltransferase n=1 Tax=Candida verbasci TaxID=1227364 RepID=A0A9W4TTI5_9ASCO|nr:unnamed protein product [Candida verbasci]